MLSRMYNLLSVRSLLNKAILVLLNLIFEKVEFGWCSFHDVGMKLNHV